MMTRTRTRTATNSFLLKLQQFFQVSPFARSRRTANLRPRRVSTHTFNNCCVSLFRSQQQRLSSFQKGEKYNQTLRYVGQQQPRTGSGISPSGDNLPRHRTHLQMLTNISTRKREKTAEEATLTSRQERASGGLKNSTCSSIKPRNVVR